MILWPLKYSGHGCNLIRGRVTKRPRGTTAPVADKAEVARLAQLNVGALASTRTTVGEILADIECDSFLQGFRYCGPV